MPSTEWVSKNHNHLSGESAKSPKTFKAMWNFKHYNPPNIWQHKWNTEDTYFKKIVGVAAENLYACELLVNVC